MHQKRVRAIALVAGLALIGAACGDDKGSSDTTAAPVTTAAAVETTAAATTTAASTAKCGQDAGTVTDGDLAGFEATTPFGKGGTDAGFIARLCSIDPKLIDLNYAAETYDAITISALAVEKAKTDGIDYAKEINGITRDGEKCTDFATCKAILDKGGDVDYDGISGPLNFAGNGEPLTASYGQLTLGANNRVDPAKTTYIEVNGDAKLDVAQVAVEGTRAGDGVFKIGSLLPQTGSLAFLGPPEFAAFDLAIQDINAAGGVLGKPIEGIKGDSGDTTTDTASKTADRLLAENVDLIVGAASSGVTLSVIDKIVGAGVTMFSPANTSTKLSDYPDKGLYFRTAPPDIYQGKVIGDNVLQDGNQTVAIIARNDAYGTSLSDEASKAIIAGGGKVVVTKIYDEKAQAFDSEIDEIKAADPDAIVIIGFDETAKILRTMVEKGIGPKVKKVYGCDGNAGNGTGQSYDAAK